MEDHDYTGTALVLGGGEETTVELVLRGHLEPIDGRFHWYGRVSPNSAIDELAGGRRKEVMLRTQYGEAPATLSDPDPWGRYRITGVSTPPFPVATELDAEK